LPIYTLKSNLVNKQTINFGMQILMLTQITLHLQLHYYMDLQKEEESEMYLLLIFIINFMQ
jgi:heme/copper-type cytochrome/quinol oxidase subunit 4